MTGFAQSLGRSATLHPYRVLILLAQWREVARNATVDYQFFCAPLPATRWNDVDAGWVTVVFGGFTIVCIT